MTKKNWVKVVVLHLEGKLFNGTMGLLKLKEDRQYTGISMSNFQSLDLDFMTLMTPFYYKKSQTDKVIIKIFGFF